MSEWIGTLQKLPWLEIVPTEASVWLASAELQWDHRDPVDRIIAATALARGEPALTKDQRFHEPLCPVEAIW